jgi:type VI secretion system protein VasD
MSFPTARRGFAGHLVLAAATAGLLFTTACSSPPPPPPPTVVKLSMTTSADVNPTASGQGAPVVVRVYQLTSSAGFEKAEFFRLLNQDTATLGSDVVKKDEFLLPPGSTKKVELSPGPTVKSIGVFGAFRDFRNATWRGVADVPPNKTTEVTVNADAKGVTVAAKPGS